MPPFPGAGAGRSLDILKEGARRTIFFPCDGGNEGERSWLRLEAEDVAGAVERIVDVSKDVVFADFLEQAALLHGEKGLRMDAGKDEGDGFFLKGVEEFFEDVNPRGVHGGDISDPEDDDGGGGFDGTHDFLEFVCRVKEERTVNFIDLDAIGNIAFGNGVGISFFVVAIVFDFPGDDSDVGDFGHAFDEEQAGQDESDFHGDGKIDENREEKGNQ